jgi:excisionase family DNA binding protein
MELVTDLEVEVGSFFVTVTWVAEKYRVPRMAVYRAIHDGRLRAIRLKGNTFVLDSRRLPEHFPRR